MAVNIGPKVSLDGWAEFRRDMNDMIQQQKTLGAEMKAVTAGFNENTSAQKKARAQAEVLSKQVKIQRERVDKLKEGLEQSKKEFGENDSRTKKWEQAVHEANAELKKMQAQLKDATAQSSKFGTAIDKAAAKIKTFAVSSVKNLPSALGSGIKTVVGGATKAIGSMTTAAAAGVVALGKIGVEYNMEMESYTTNFETMLGSAEAAAKKVNSLKTMAAKTPFEMTDLADATQQLLAMGVANEDTNTYLQQLGDISLGNVEKFNSLIGAFGKMNSSQKVTLEYINIMAEQGFNPLNLIAQKTGESMSDLYKRVSAGKVSFDEVKAAIATATSAGGQFYQGMDKASRTTAGLISSLKDNATALVGEVFTPISDGIAQKVLPGAINAIDQLSEAFRTKGISGMVTAAGQIITDTLGQFTKGLPEFANVAVGIVESLLDGLGSNMGAIADGAVETVMVLADGIIDLLPELIVTGTLLIAKLAAGLILGIPDLIRQVPTMVKEICDGFKAQSGQWKQIGIDMIWGICGGLEEAWTIVAGWFSDIGEWVAGLFNGKGGSSGKTPKIDGSHATGLSYVPFDGYLAQLHQGEMVLTKAQASALRRKEVAVAGTNVNYGGININIYPQPGQDPQQIADVVLDRIQTEIIRKEAAW